VNKQAWREHINESWLYNYERPVLVWLALRLPKKINSDHLTVFGVAGALLAAIGFALSTVSADFLLVAPLGLLFNWLGDSLDGTLARVRNEERPRLGFLVDHTVDIVSQIILGLGCGLSPFVRLDMACLALIGYLVLVAYTFLRANVLSETKISYFRMGPTEIRIFLVMTALYFYYAGNWTPEIFGFAFRFSDAASFLIFVIEIAFFVAAALEDWRKLSAASTSANCAIPRGTPARTPLPSVEGHGGDRAEGFRPGRDQTEPEPASQIRTVA
jgi:archaetidylinositol phosphate synthase